MIIKSILTAWVLSVAATLFLMVYYGTPAAAPALVVTFVHAVLGVSMVGALLIFLFIVLTIIWGD